MTTANTRGATRNDGPDGNRYDGVFTGETRTITNPSIDSIGNNKFHPDTSMVTATGPFVAGKVPTKHTN